MLSWMNDRIFWLRGMLNVLVSCYVSSYDKQGHHELNGKKNKQYFMEKVGMTGTRFKNKMPNDVGVQYS